MKIDPLTPTKEVLKELGIRLSKIRRQRKISQDTLAQEAGIGVATLRRIEAGNDSQLESWIKIMKALDLTASLNTVLPEEIKSPMAEITGRKRIKKRERPVWGDESE